MVGQKFNYAIQWGPRGIRSDRRDGAARSGLTVNMGTVLRNEKATVHRPKHGLLSRSSLVAKHVAHNADKPQHADIANTIEYAIGVFARHQNVFIAQNS